MLLFGQSRLESPLILDSEAKGEALNDKIR